MHAVVNYEQQMQEDLALDPPWVAVNVLSGPITNVHPWGHHAEPSHRLIVQGLNSASHEFALRDT
jgi:hypothetical protein